MDDRNPPLALPNGYVYSKNALTAQAKLNADIVTCPQTKQHFLLTQAKPAYVL
jgi:macrophage erythroblast attacher